MGWGNRTQTMDQLVEKRGKRIPRSAEEYNWGVQPGMTERSIAPKDPTPAGSPAHPRAFG